MVIGILKENSSENRVAILPGEVIVLKKLNLSIFVETGAGERAYSDDQDYVKAGAVIVNRKELISGSDLLLAVNPPVEEPAGVFRRGQVICSLLYPYENGAWIETMRTAGITYLALDLIPRITRAQSMDVLSSMATVAGYKAVLHAASLLPRFFPMFMSASGTIKPARVLILGAGVAGLQALAISRKLGAIVEVFDVRSAVRDEVKSLGGKFIEVEGAREDSAAGGYAVEQTEEFRQKQSQMIQKSAVAADIIICTAQIPGKKAPVLITAETARSMKPGSVIIDMASSTGGNCELTEHGRNISVNMIKIIGKTDYPSEMPSDASRMFGNNIINLLKLVINKEGNAEINLSDEIIKGTLAFYNGDFVSERIKQILKIE
ncbi:MAG TPA: Re/Si-specific NAD(P)(+) transhydrogenase subunit alpha [Bacteroidales bacterium]|nr:Re/Si-specific NAD(P)(+) transhydrogenase subunit alpha [Bacteroidales bacterium]